jgi:putative ABC transport system substrate-binding protein
VRRREFIAGIGGAAAWPLTVRAQQAERVRRIGFLSFTNELDQLIRTQTVLLEALAKLGWAEGHNLRIDVRGAAAIDQLRECAAELVKLSPDVIVTSGVAAADGSESGNSVLARHFCAE